MSTADIMSFVVNVRSVQWWFDAGRNRTVVSPRLLKMCPKNVIAHPSPEQVSAWTIVLSNACSCQQKRPDLLSMCSVVERRPYHTTHRPILNRFKGRSLANFSLEQGNYTARIDLKQLAPLVYVERDGWASDPRAIHFRIFQNDQFLGPDHPCNTNAGHHWV
jgi:hypothetical protein